MKATGEKGAISHFEKLSIIVLKTDYMKLKVVSFCFHAYTDVHGFIKSDQKQKRALSLMVKVFRMFKLRIVHIL